MTAPPYIPLWTACSRVRTSTTASTSPRSDVVSEGTPIFQLLESASTRTSALSLSRCLRRIRPSEGDPDSSSPSTKTVTPTGGRPPWARIAARWAITPALSSAAPRP